MAEFQFDPESAKPVAQFDPDSARPVSIGREFARGVSSGVDAVQQGLYGLTALAGHATGLKGVEDWGREGVVRNEQEMQATAPAVGRIEDIGGVHDAALWASHGLGQLAPFMLSSLAGGGVGGIAGRAAGAAAARGVVSKAAAEGVIREAAKRGAIAGAGATSIGQETGSITADQISDNGNIDALKAVGYGIPAGLLDVVPESRLISKFTSGGKKTGLLRDVATQFGMEASTEAAQTGLERAGAGKEVFSPEGRSEMLNAAALGGLGGGIITAAAHPFQRDAVQPDEAPPPALPAPNQTVQRMGEGNTPSDLVQAQATAAAASHAEQVYAERAAEEQRLAAFAANGPISAAAATAMGNGAAAQSTAQRMEELAPESDPLALPAPVDEREKAQQKTLDTFLSQVTPEPLAEAQQAAQAFAADGLETVVVPHPSGGFVAAPASFVGPAVRRQFEGIQSAGRLPAPDAARPGVFAVDSAGTAQRTTYDQNPVAQRNAFTEMRRENDQPAPRGAEPGPARKIPNQIPIKNAKQAQKLAARATAAQGVEFEVVPHPLSSSKFAIAPVVQAPAIEGEVTDRQVDVGQQAPAVAGITQAEQPPAAPTVVDIKANAAATSLHNDLPQPTQKQTLAGNYKKGHLTGADHPLLKGLGVTIENPKGSVRVAADGSWASTTPHHYGYVKGTLGNDGDPIDVTLGDGSKAFVIEQVDPKTGKLDEHKVMAGFESAQEAEQAYRDAYPADWKGFGSIIEVGDNAGLRRWLENNDARAPSPDLSAEAIETITIDTPVEIEETGETVVIKQGARDALVDSRSRVRMLEQLLRCVSK